MTFQQIKVVIHGRVQGVFYRQSTHTIATKLNVTGYVRNTHKGTVEALFEGNKENINKMLEWCKIGPSLAKVAKIEILERKDINQPDYHTFSIDKTRTGF